MNDDQKIKLINIYFRTNCQLWNKCKSVLIQNGNKKNTGILLYNKVSFVNISISFLDVFGQSTNSLTDMESPLIVATLCQLMTIFNLRWASEKLVNL